MALLIANQPHERAHHRIGADLDPADHERQQANGAGEAVHRHDLGILHAVRPADMHVVERNPEGKEADLRLSAEGDISACPACDLLTDLRLQSLARHQRQKQPKKRNGGQSYRREDPNEALHAARVFAANWP